MVNHWLFKSEPETYSIDDLKKDTTTCWDGVRNYQARNFMKEAKKGDLVFFYHSNTHVPGIYGIATICKEAYPDHTQFDKKSKYFDEKSSPENPRWFMVDLKFKQKLKKPVSLQQMKETSSLQEMHLVQKGNRLSVMPVTEKEWKIISDLT